MGSYHKALHPGRLTWNLRIHSWKRKSSAKPSFLGSMLIFGGVLKDDFPFPYDIGKPCEFKNPVFFTTTKQLDPDRPDHRSWHHSAEQCSDVPERRKDDTQLLGYRKKTVFWSWDYINLFQGHIMFSVSVKFLGVLKKDDHFYIYTQRLQVELHAKHSCLAEIRLILRAQRDKSTHQATTCGPRNGHPTSNR